MSETKLTGIKLYGMAAFYSAAMIGSMAALAGLILLIGWYGGPIWVAALAVGGLFVIYFFKALKFIREEEDDQTENQVENTR